MAKFIKQHKLVHIWAAGVLAVFCAYWYGISSPEAANAVSGATQALKECELCRLLVILYSLLIAAVLKKLRWVCS